MGWMKQRFLGSGSYGRVYLAEQPGHMAMAVKSANIQHSWSLRREGEFLNLLRGCPYIVRCLGEDTSVECGVDVYNLLLEYASGGTLNHLIKSHGGNMPESDVAWYTYQLLCGIHHVHSLGFVHCDIKPGNVLVFPTQYGGNRLKLCDFGLSKRAGESNTFGDSHCGTLLYTSPESLICGEHKAPQDIWALGCIVFEMITGKPVWQVSGNDELAMNITLNEPEIPDSISLSGMDFLKKCFDLEPRCRWTAKMLLSHPFVSNHRFDLAEREEDEGFLNNPFGSTTWSTNRGLFTVPPSPKPPPRPSACFEYVLFPEKDKEADRSSLILPELSFCA